jgi:hypothetical protein
MVTDLNGSWKMKSDNEIFQIERIDDENFKVFEPDTNKEYEFHLSLGGKNDGHTTSSQQFWDGKLIIFKSENSFTLTGSLEGHHWYFERTERFE